MRTKIGILLLVLLLAVSFTGCGDRDISGDTESGSNVSEDADGGKTKDIDDSGDDIETHGKEPAEGNDSPDESRNGTLTEEPAEPVNNTGQLTGSNGQGSNIAQESKEDPVLTCTFSITCHTVFDNLDKLDPVKLEILPEDGVIYKAKKVEFQKGENVFDVLLRETKASRLHMEFSSNPALKSKYVEGINNLYEFDCGVLSGWTYKINGKGVGIGSSNYILSDGDTVEWVYTCDQGRDVGVTAE